MNPFAAAAAELSAVRIPLRQQPRIEAGKLRPLIEYRERRVMPTLKNPLGLEIVPYIIGHGRQLARRPEAEKAAWVAATYRRAA